jgi:CubicO group peptidase (beta-lactamase class C family)
MLGDDADGEGEERYVALTKRAGLGRCDPGHPEAVLTLEHWCNELAKIPLRSHPGKEWFYSYGLDVIGRALEIVTGEPLNTLLDRQILGPLHMVDTSFEIPMEKWDRVAGMYRKVEETDAHELQRIDAAERSRNEWMVGNASPILSGGGCIDQYAGGLVSTATDFARFCSMMLHKGELDGVRILRESTVELFTRNMLPAATGADNVWAGGDGVGFCFLGSVSVDHPELDVALRPKEYGWGGMAGTAWTNDPVEDFFLLSFSLVAFDLTTEEELRAGVRKAIEMFATKKDDEMYAGMDCRGTSSSSVWALPVVCA